MTKRGYLSRLLHFLKLSWMICVCMFFKCTTQWRKLWFITEQNHIDVCSRILGAFYVFFWWWYTILFSLIYRYEKKTKEVWLFSNQILIMYILSIYYFSSKTIKNVWIIWILLLLLLHCAIDQNRTQKQTCKLLSCLWPEIFCLFVVLILFSLNFKSD